SYSIFSITRQVPWGRSPPRHRICLRRSYNPNTGLPYSGQQSNDLWHEVCKIAGINSSVNWNRDLPASGITEGDDADAPVEDAATQAGHNPLTTKRTYIRGIAR
ncbi:MAG: hypothetical protein KGJ00_12990, partial [Bradyrhizobium sp.]|nr:hypothetical protein [Bradyrhizobium sp.]